MDNLSHSLAGLVIGRAGLNRLTPRAAPLLIVSANLPDIDIVALARSQFSYLEAHRGITHAIVALPFLGFLAVVLVAALFRERLPWGKAWLLCCIGVASHLLLDWTNSYGIRLLLPFSSRWFHLDLNSLTDGPFLVALAVALVWPLLSGLVSGEIGGRQKSAGRGIALAVLSFCCFYEAARFQFHRQAIEQLESRLYDSAVPVDAAALPGAINPFQWLGIVTTQKTFLELTVDTQSQLNPESARAFFRVPLTDITAHARRQPEFSFFLKFARFPVWSIQPVALHQGTGRRIELTDLRFGEPGRGSFHCVAVENEQTQVLRSWFTFGNGAGLGWSDPN